MPSHAAARIFFQLGNIYFRSGDSSQAEDCYRKAAALSPGLQALANLAATLIRAGKHQEAAVIAAKVALTDPASARRLADQLPKEGAPQAGQPRFGQGANTGMGGHTDAPTQPKEFDLEALRTAPPQARAAARQAPPEPAGRKSGFEMETLQDAMGTPAAPAAPSRSREPEAGVSGRMNALNLETLQGTLAAPSAEQGQASLEPAAPRIPPGISNRRTFSQDQGADMQSLQEAMRSPSSQDGQERRPEEFLSGAYKLASDLEREFGGKVHFNREGLTAVEKKLRICAKQGKFSSAPELIKDCSAFLCYFLQERHKGRLVKLADCEPWAWPMIFKQQDATVTTYPVQRVWRLLWDENLPEPGWLAKYADWLAGSLSSAAGRPTGADAVRSGTKSHPERLIDTQTEHKRIMKLVSTLAETSDIELGRPGVAKLAAAIRNNFKPDIPPSADGWKLLRCFGHILAATLAKDFKADWYNTDGEDGRWSMQLPWGAFVFPIGKIYKTASQREDLGDYYAAMLSEWLKRQPKNQ